MTDSKIGYIGIDVAKHSSYMAIAQVLADKNILVVIDKPVEPKHDIQQWLKDHPSTGLLERLQYYPFSNIKGMKLLRKTLRKNHQQ